MIDRIACGGVQQGEWMRREPTDTASTAAARGRRKHSLESASPSDEKGLDVEGSSWSQAESSAMKTSAPRWISRPLAKPPPETMLMEIGKTATSLEVAKTPAPWWVPTVVGVSLTVRIGGT